MTKREGERLVGRCHAICKLDGNLSRKAVFSAVEIDDEEKERAVYYCGLGERDCIMTYYGQKFNDVAQLADRAAREAHHARNDGPVRFKG